VIVKIGVCLLLRLVGSVLVTLALDDCPCRFRLPFRQGVPIVNSERAGEAGRGYDNDQGKDHI
jgi:hypothetical protein